MQEGERLKGKEEEIYPLVLWVEASFAFKSFLSSHEAYLRSPTCLLVFSFRFIQWKSEAEGFIKYIDICKTLQRLLSVSVLQPAICPSAGDVGGEKRSISHSVERCEA